MPENRNLDQPEKADDMFNEDEDIVGAEDDSDEEEFEDTEEDEEIEDESRGQ